MDNDEFLTARSNELDSPEMEVDEGWKEGPDTCSQLRNTDGEGVE